LHCSSIKRCVILLVLIRDLSSPRETEITTAAMNNDTTFSYLPEFYGSSKDWFAIWIWVASIFVISSDIFFITVTLSTPSLCSNTANWFLVGFSLSDLLHCTFQLFEAYAIWTGSVENRHLCEIAGIFVLCTATCCFGFPAMIAAVRYAVIQK
jgi:hypothetical protein